MRRLEATPEELFWAKVNKTETCWLWTASLGDKGYGRFRTGNREYKAHRWAYLNLVGPVESGLELDHLCRIRSCVNPSHLEPVTHRVNMLRGHTIVAAKAAQTLCKRGHALDLIDHRGCRKCSTCTHEWNLAHREYFRLKMRERRARAKQSARRGAA